jgi:hypothetical protein
MPRAQERTETITTNNVSEAPCDRCLIGSWEATNDSMVAYMQSAGVAGEAPGPVIRSIIGKMFMEFDAIGTGIGGYEKLRVHETGAGNIEGVDVFVTFDGYSSGRYTANGSLLTGLSDTTGVSVSVEIFLNGNSLGTSSDPLKPEDFPIRTGYPTRYTCEGDTLTSWPFAEGVSAEPLVWTRLNP